MSHPVPCRVRKPHSEHLVDTTTLVLPYYHNVTSCPILPCRTISCPVPSCLVQLSYIVTSCLVFSYSVTSCSVLPYSVTFCPVLSYFVTSCPVLSYSVTTCPVLSYTLSCPMSCVPCPVPDHSCPVDVVVISEPVISSPRPCPSLVRHVRPARSLPGHFTIAEMAGDDN